MPSGISEETSAAASLLGKIGAHVSWANTKDRTARTAPARAALEQKFLDQADGDPVRAEHLRKVYYQRLALKSVQARRKARGASPPTMAATQSPLATQTGGRSQKDRGPNLRANGERQDQLAGGDAA